ncbi:putative mRNA guanylyltransferase [Dioszegia hungarica]|uniref:mRNA-capping enzyme subunit alpha n=1 Tax=Dioszegia hungarica TaxID=4972 RepID=A0AA38HDS9_9TREE|nr:putative mRNA guanylyltransferase [Dioszegia hungarica]KAI9638508.1 putative mRNA guanylyltransferase [Dioszegia hungarica]
MPTHSPIPDIPGEEADPTIAAYLSSRVAELCGLREPRFPGAQPVSFTSGSLDLLEQKNFWVCEKSDGVRLLVFVVMNGMSGAQEVWLIDRKQRYFSVQGLRFPHWERKDQPLTDTIFDGELVVDIDSSTGESTLRFYAFDCLVLNGDKVVSKPIQSRFGRLKSWIVEPFNRALAQYPEWRDDLPFEVVAKEQLLSYHMKTVLDVHVPALQHGHDGLIFTCAESEYVMGTDEKILKWKPPSENSVDFKLELRFPPSSYSAHDPDYTAKPVFLLHTWLGREAYEYFDELLVEDDEWEKMKESGEQFDDRIIEVCWNTDMGGWRMMRIRDDKPHANHKSIMQKILVSIEDGVKIEALLARSDSIRTAWKTREKAGGAAPPQQQRPPQPIAVGGRDRGVNGGTGVVQQTQGIVAGLRR